MPTSQQGAGAISRERRAIHRSDIIATYCLYAIVALAPFPFGSVDPKIIAVWVLLLSATLSWRACGHSIPAISFSRRVSLWWPWPGLSSLLSSSAQHRYLQENWCLRFGRKPPSSSGKICLGFFLWPVTSPISQPDHNLHACCR